jgi:hypothetical protein
MSQDKLYCTASISATCGTQWVGTDLSDGSHIWVGGQNEYLEKSTPTRTKLNGPLKEGIEMKNLYEVFLVYGEDRKNPVISATERVIANDDEDARVKSGIYSKVEKEWDADYLTIIVHNLGAVKIKEKAKEVKNV